MPLNALTLTVTNGVVGRPFAGALGGKSAGTQLRVKDGSAPGFGIINGVLSSLSMPYENASVTIIEFDPRTRERNETTFTLNATRAALVSTVAADGSITYTGGGSGAAPTAQTGTASTSGVVYTVQRLLGSTSTLSLVTGSNSNLSINSTTGAISAASAIAVGASQTANVREASNGLAVEYPVTITGVNATPAPTPTPTPTPSGSINGVAIGTLATTGPEAGMTLVYGDDFDGPLDIMGPAPQNRFGRYATTRGNYLIFDSGQQPRASTGLGGVDSDPYWTGHNDSNRGVPIASLTDIMVQQNGKISLRQRDMVTGEAAQVPINNQNVMSSMIHGAFDVMVSAPFVYKWEEQRFANTKDHMTTWFMQNMGFTRGDIELDFEAASKKDNTGDGRQLEFNINVWEGVNRIASRSAGSNPVTVDWSTPKTMAMHADAQGTANFYLEGQLGYQFATEQANVLSAPYHFVASNHMYNVARPTGVSRLEYGYWQLWVPGKHYVPQVAPTLIQVASGEAKTTVLPTQAALWGETGLTEKVEACMVEPNEPGGTTNGQFYLDLPTGVTYNASTRELAVNVTTPGRLNIGRYVIKSGCSSKVYRIAVEVGPVIKQGDFTATQGMPVNIDLYAAVDCGILVTNGTAKAKTITVSGLPTGLSYNDSTGFITGSTTVATGLRSVTITATNSVGQQATKTINVNVAAVPAAGEYAYQNLSGLVANFDASRDAAFPSATGDVPTWGNGVAGAGDLSKPSGVSVVPTRVANVLGGKPVVRFVRGADGATSPVLESAQNASGATVPVAGNLNGSDTPFTLVMLFKAANGTGNVAGWSEQVNSTAARNATTVKRSGSASSFRYGATSAGSADVSLGTLADDTWYLVVERHNGGGTSDAWVNKTRVLTAAAHTSSSGWTSTARFSIGNVQGNTANASRYPATAFSGDIAEVLAFNVAVSDSDITQMMNDIYTKWSLT